MGAHDERLSGRVYILSAGPCPEGRASVPPALQAAVAANGIIAACYFVISALIFIGLVRERRLGFNPLATATCLIFFTCGLGHATHVEHYLEQASFYASLPDLWHQALTDGLTVIPAVIYLTLRRRYGLVIRGPHALLDFQRRLRMAETLRVIGRDVSARTEIDDLLARVAQHAHELLEADYTVVVAVNGEGNVLVKASGNRAPIADESAWQRAAAAPGTPAALDTIDRGEPLLVAERAGARRVSLLDDPIHQAEGGRSVMVVPLGHAGKIAGSLMIGFRTRRSLDADVVATAEALASHVTVAVENARLIGSLRHAEQVKGEFLTIAAHELKTPVTSLRGYAQLTRRHISNTSELNVPRIAQALEVIDRQSTRLGSLVSQLLDVSRLDTDHLTLDLAEADLVSLVESVIGTTRLSMPDHEIVLAASGPVVAMVDGPRLEQVVVNLIDNAAKFSPAGTRIDVSVGMLAPDTVKIEVADQGSGISSSHLPHIFERAYQGGDIQRTAGLGLGLYISRQVVALHGGQIEAESPPEGGARLTITLPIQPAASTLRQNEG
jgi:signal transduction histidine kinase